MNESEVIDGGGEECPLVKSLDEKVSLTVLSTASTSQHVQYMPSTIMGCGTTEVEDRFNNFTETDSNTSGLTNSLRGYSFEGKVMSLPTGNPRLVMEEDKAGFTSQDREHLDVISEGHDSRKQEGGD